jgi:hypothetical protein
MNKLFGSAVLALTTLVTVAHAGDRFEVLNRLPRTYTDAVIVEQAKVKEFALDLGYGAVFVVRNITDKQLDLVMVECAAYKGYELVDSYVGSVGPLAPNARKSGESVMTGVMTVRPDRVECSTTSQIIPNLPR